MSTKKYAFFIMMLVIILIASVAHAQDSATVIEFDSTEFGTLTTSNPFELWQFEGFAADLISVSMNQVMSDLDPYVIIKDPLGRVIGSDNDTNYPNAFVDNLRLPLTGTYTIVAQSMYDTTGDYEISLARLEPGMVYGQQSNDGEIEFNLAVIGGISNESRLDKWTFEGLPGSSVSITMKRLSGTLSLYFILLDPDQNMIANVSNSYDEVATVDRDLSLAGTYTIMIQRPPGDTTAGDYELEIVQLEQGFTPLDGGGDIAYNTQSAGTIWVEDVEDKWQVEATSGDSIDIVAQLTSETDGNSSHILQLIAPTNEILALGNYDYNTFMYMIQGYVIPEDGTYSVIFSISPNSYSYAPMNYTLDVKYLRNLSYAQETTLIVGERRVSAILPNHPVDEWQFDGVAGDRMVIAAFPLVSSMRVFLSLVASDGRILTTTDSDNYYYSQGEPSILDVTLPTSDTYRIIAHADISNLESIGNYVIQTTVTEAGDGRTIISGGGEMVLNEIVTGLISNQDPDDRYYLQIDTPIAVTFTIARADGNLNGYLEILDETGAVVASDDDSAGALNPLLTNVALTEGRYLVVVRRPDGDTLSQGVYELSIVTTSN